MDGKGEQSLDGLKTNLRVGIAYLRGWNQNIGCVSWDNLMEDLATLEISRAQTWQWLHHNVQLTNGSNVSPDLIKREFANELNKILEEVDQTMNNSSTEEINQVKQEFTIAKENAEVLFLKTELPDFLSLASDRVQ
jgi:malate synthase